MDDLKLSPWHDGKEKPVNVGIYQRLWGAEIAWTYWDGDNWGLSYPILDYDGYKNAKFAYWSTGLEQELPWRGIVK